MKNAKHSNLIVISLFLQDDSLAALLKGAHWPSCSSLDLHLPSGCLDFRSPHCLRRLGCSRPLGGGVSILRAARPSRRQGRKVLFQIEFRLWSLACLPKKKVFCFSTARILAAWMRGESWGVLFKHVGSGCMQRKKSARVQAR